MASSTDPLERFETAVRTDLMTWPQLPAFRHSMAPGRPSRHFMAAVSVSVIMHAFLTFLLWGGAADRREVDPAVPSIGKPLTVTLVSLPTPDKASHALLERETVSSVPHTDPPAQRSEPSPEHAPDTEPKSEVEPDMTSKDKVTPDSKAFEVKTIVADATPSVDPEAVHSISQEIGRTPESEAGAIVIPESLGIRGSEVSRGKFPATGAAPSIDLEAAYSLAREVGRMSVPDFEVQRLRFESRALYLKNHLGITMAPPPSDCRTAYAGMGYFAIPFLLKDTITDSGCTWQKNVRREEQRKPERQKEQERLKFFTDIINELTFTP